MSDLIKWTDIVRHFANRFTPAPSRSRLGSVVGAVWFSLWIGAAVLSGQDADSEAQKHFLAARQAQSAGDLGTAAREYAAVLRLHPGIAEVYGNLGLVYYLEAKFDESAEAFEKALALKPGLRGSDLFLGIDYVRLYRPQRAIPHLEKAVEQEPMNKEARTWLSSGLWDSGQTAAAIVQLSEAVHDFPGDADFLFLLGEGYRKSANREVEKVLAAVPRGGPFYHQIFGDIDATRGDWDKAIAHYRRAIELDAHWADAHYGLAEVYLQQNKPEDAQAEFRHEQQLDPPDASYKRALTDFNRGAFEEAEAALVAQTRDDPKNLKARYLLGRTYQQLSLSVLDRLLKTDPDSFRAHQLQAETYAYREENGKALAEYRIVEQMRPELPGLHFAMGDLLWKSDDNSQALAQLQQELRINPNHAEANAEIGAILVSEHQPNQAIPYLRKALRLKPDLVMVHEQLGKAYFQRQEFAQAVGELNRGLAPDDQGNVHYVLGMVYKKMGRMKEARAAFEQSRRIKTERLAEATIQKADQPDSRSSL
ncbi:MAG: tetratricopeptide repeat protein [Bryobacteraceae bacterium]